jgi:hypothetical protein
MTRPKEIMMNRPLLPRLAAACGIVFPIAMFLAVGNGTNFAPWRAVASTWALVLFLPFLAYLCNLLRTAVAPEDGWLSTLALIAGTSGILLKLVSHAPELAIHQDHLAKSTPLYNALDHTAGAATILCLYPLALFTAVVALVTIRERVLPRWIGVFAALTATALAINGGFLFAGFVPALLLFLLWTLLTAVVLLRRTRVTSAQLAYAT